jgi:hypothetical protein
MAWAIWMALAAFFCFGLSFICRFISHVINKTKK